MKQTQSYSIDNDVVEALQKYMDFLISITPEPLQAGYRKRSAVVNKILRDYLEEKGYIKGGS